MKFDNFLKGPLSSILGIIIMGGSAFGMIDGRLNPWPEGVIVFALGFALLFLRDELPGFVKKFFTKKLEE